MISSADYPALYVAADAASGRAQRLYLALFKASVTMMIVGALSTTVGGISIALRTAGLLAGALLLLVSFVLNVIIRLQAPERVWFAGRAVAESVKTASWRYMTCAPPFCAELGSKTVDEMLLSELALIVKERKALGWNLGGDLSQPQITDKMRQIRSSPLETRVNIYRDDRIGIQTNWYATQSELNRREHTRWFYLTTGAQLFSLTWAMLLLSGNVRVNLTGVFSASAAGAMAWTQVKKYQELAQSYAMAAMDLGIAREKLAHVAGDIQFEAFVADSESAISREHTMWITRRDTI
jgi:hypothetical protein